MTGYTRKTVYHAAMTTPLTNQDRYQQVFREVPVMAALLDTEGRFLDVSDQWVRRSGYSIDELRGKAPEEIATAESALRCREEYLPGFRRTGKLDHVPLGLVAKDGAT